MPVVHTRYYTDPACPWSWALEPSFRRLLVEFGPSLTGVTGPPRSGGLLAALHLWQRILLLGPRKFGEVYYLGEMPRGKADQLLPW